MAEHYIVRVYSALWMYTFFFWYALSFDIKKFLILIELCQLKYSQTDLYMPPCGKSMTFSYPVADAGTSELIKNHWDLQKQLSKKDKILLPRYSCWQYSCCMTSINNNKNQIKCICLTYFCLTLSHSMFSPWISLNEVKTQHRDETVMRCHT